MKAQGVAALFDDYRKNVMPAAAPEVQVTECRRAFFAATYAMVLNLIYNLGDESTSEDDAERQLKSLREECEAFAKQDGLRLPTPEYAHVPEPHNYQVDDPDMKATLRRLGGVIGEALPEGLGFTLLLFTYGEGGNLFYISSAERADMIATMNEFIRKQLQ